MHGICFLQCKVSFYLVFNSSCTRFSPRHEAGWSWPNTSPKQIPKNPLAAGAAGQGLPGLAVEGAGVASQRAEDCNKGVGGGKGGGNKQQEMQ